MSFGTSRPSRTKSSEGTKDVIGGGRKNAFREKAWNPLKASTSLGLARLTRFWTVCPLIREIREADMEMEVSKNTREERREGERRFWLFTDRVNGQWEIHGVQSQIINEGALSETSETARVTKGLKD